MIIDKDKFPTEVDHIVHSVHDGENLLHLVHIPLVRCKDCKYCDRHHLVDGLFCYRLYEKYNKEYPQMIIEVDTDDFCSRGEKKDATD